MADTRSEAPKYQQVYAALRRDIESGRWKPGERLPTEVDLVRTFQASRITVGRAVRDLQSAGLVQRRAGSGTYVAAAPPSAKGLSFGLLIPDLGETEIFEAICQGMMSSPLARAHALLWGSLTGGGPSREDRTWSLCQQYVDRRVSGVFFAPVELTPHKDDVNQRIVRALEAARIPTVLLDRPAFPYPERGGHDLVGIDNRRAGFVVTDHLQRLGCRRIAFVALPNAAATVEAREAGYREALYASNHPIDRAAVRRIDPSDSAAVGSLIDDHRPDGIVCANDRTAGALMHTLLAAGISIPGDVRLVGIDDIEYARLLPVPLTTLRQPTRQIGDAALAAMLERVHRPDGPARDILLHCELIVRASCGASARDCTAATVLSQPSVETGAR
jgi:GntR family transcriptional regulator, arabinose operon transcriptional repressor